MCRIQNPRSARFVSAFLFLACISLGCKGAVKPAEEKVPPAPVKWENLREMFVEEWTELIGSTQPLPDHAARVTTPVAGQVVSVLRGGDDKPVFEGQLVEEGTVLAQLDASAILAKLDTAKAAKKTLQAEREVAETVVKLAKAEVKSLDTLKKTQPVPEITVEKAALAQESAEADRKSVV
jgi:multidrug efflux pump subunit AcrA (membrane-fusion protein)